MARDKERIAVVYDRPGVKAELERAAALDGERPSEYVRRVVRAAIEDTKERALRQGRPLPPLAE